MNEKLINAVSEELRCPAWAGTEQCLEVFQVEYEGDNPIVEHIEIDEIENYADVYVRVKNESFYLHIRFDISDVVEIASVHTAPYIRIDFSLRSEDLSVEQLLSFISIEPSEVTRRDDYLGDGDSYNEISFLSFSHPGRIHSKLNYLLDVLETDSSGIKNLIQATKSNNLFVTIVFHAGNSNLVGLYVEDHAMKRLAALGLSLTI
jgi:hypothetical protein